MVVIRFFCVILACSLLFVQTSIAESSTKTAEATTLSVGTSPETDTTQASSTETHSSSSEATTNSSSVSTEITTQTSKSNETTTELTATPTVPSTTVPSTTPAPPDFTWEVTNHDENKTVCLKVHLEMSFKNTNGSQDLFTLPTNASVDQSKSSCGPKNKSQVMVLTYDDKVVILTFDKDVTDKETPKFHLSYLTFVNGTVAHNLNGTSETMVAHVEKSYKCNDEETHPMSGDVSVTWKDVQIQAFMDEKDDGNFGAAEECSQDNTSDIVPIAVGCALAGLVVVVLIAYLVGRRRSRQKGYQSV
uniref:Lysosome-associated membrane glycoprotein 5 n=1 Tax=Strigamia maritima TaxID=126957 RepID=T1IW12_STRMM